LTRISPAQTLFVPFKDPSTAAQATLPNKEAHPFGLLSIAPKFHFRAAEHVEVGNTCANDVNANALTSMAFEI